MLTESNTTGNTNDGMTGFPVDPERLIRQWLALTNDIRGAADHAFYWLQARGGELPLSVAGRCEAFAASWYKVSVDGDAYRAALALRFKISNPGDAGDADPDADSNFQKPPETLIQQGGAADETAETVNACAVARKAFKNPSLFQKPGDEKIGPTSDAPSVWKRLENELQAIGYPLRWFRSPFAPRRGLEVATAFYGWFAALEGYGREIGLGLEDVVRRAAAVIRELRPGATTREVVGARGELDRRIKAALRAIAPAGRRRISETRSDAQRRGETPVAAPLRVWEGLREPARPASLSEKGRDALAALRGMTGAHADRRNGSTSPA
jgi:hypothetical protein